MKTGIDFRRPSLKTDVEIVCFGLELVSDLDLESGHPGGTPPLEIKTKNTDCGSSSLF